MRRPLIAGNWKMYKGLEEALAFARAFAPKVAHVDARDILICPPFVAIHALAQVFAGTNVLLGGQNVHHEDQGAFTGEVSAPMLKSAGATHVIIGHSERRQLFGETDEGVNRKVHASLRSSLSPVVCVGETLSEREAGLTLEVVGKQIERGLHGLGQEGASSLAVAYEPVWAIGTGRTATPSIAQEVHAFIREVLSKILGPQAASRIRILYGGSVKPDNVDELMAEPDIDGVLVGGASLEPESFERIVKYRG
ncbi:MAG TPA: triose-phosphate isomerase [Deltaproteobacteria bacterium]|nr:triose-phosphate isomerase [Deltaproteobacteria bacterium]HOM27948.1 triose-phosphate isomerase [Deltaproteobacteria bacterium]HPP80784.1 triose-phosphate isomerase [Deltaproteobacteria bacterium]